MKYSGIGGQAVIEGIMMRHGRDYAVAVRRENGEIAVKKDVYDGLEKKYPVFGLPLFRGVASFADSMVLGMKALECSAEYFAAEDEPGEKDSLVMTAVMILSVVAGIAIFILFPLFLASLLKPLLGEGFFMAAFEGLLRVAIFIAYICVISRMEDIARTFRYHGAEHKCINCLEHGMELNVENVKKSSRFHKRCGTSFLIIVMIISIVFFMLVRTDGILLRLVSRIVLIPVIAGVSYEFLRFAGRHEGLLVDLVSVPGMWMQKLTTAEPDEGMIEVAIQSVDAVFDWRKYLEENFK